MLQFPRYFFEKKILQNRRYRRYAGTPPESGRFPGQKRGDFVPAVYRRRFYSGTDAVLVHFPEIFFVEKVFGKLEHTGAFWGLPRAPSYGIVCAHTKKELAMSEKHFLECGECLGRNVLVSVWAVCEETGAYASHPLGTVDWADEIGFCEDCDKCVGTNFDHKIIVHVEDAA